jgi:hypothetical protein
MLASLKAMLRQLANRAPDEYTFVISFPRSGRTWHRLMAGYYLARLTGAAEDNAFRIAKMCTRARLNPVCYSHNDTGFKDGLKPSSRFVASPRLWQGHNVLFLVRNPRDVLVSAYHNATSRSSRFHGTLSEFVRKPETGVAKVMKAYNTWHANRHLAASHRIHSYEEMHRDPAAVLRSRLEFFGLKSFDDTLLADAVQFCRLENMRHYERSDRFKVKQLRNTSGLPVGAKVREGGVGASATVLSAVDRAFIDAHIVKVGDPFADYY